MCVVWLIVLRPCVLRHSVQIFPGALARRSLGCHGDSLVGVDPTPGLPFIGRWALSEWRRSLGSLSKQVVILLLGLLSLLVVHDLMLTNKQIILAGLLLFPVVIDGTGRMVGVLLLGSGWQVVWFRSDCSGAQLRKLLLRCTVGGQSRRGAWSGAQPTVVLLVVDAITVRVSF